MNKPNIYRMIDAFWLFCDTNASWIIRSHVFLLSIKAVVHIGSSVFATFLLLLTCVIRRSLRAEIDRANACRRLSVLESRFHFLIC